MIHDAVYFIYLKNICQHLWTRVYPCPNYTPGIYWLRPDYTPPAHIIPPILSGVARVYGAWDKCQVCHPPPIANAYDISRVINAAHSNG